MPAMGFGFQRNPAIRGPSDQGHQGNMQITQRRDPFASMWPFGGGDPFARMDTMMVSKSLHPTSKSIGFFLI